MEKITLESIYSLLQETNVRLETAEENIRFLMNEAGREKGTAAAVDLTPVAPDISNLPTATHKGKKYQFFAANFRLKGDTEIYISKDAADVPELLERLLSIKDQRILREVF